MRETWLDWERLIVDRGIVIDRPKGSAHPRYPAMIYPLDYGHIPGTVGGDGDPVDLFVGEADTGLIGLLKTRDAVKRDEEIKLLWNLNPAEVGLAAEFLRSHGLDVEIVWRSAG